MKRKVALLLVVAMLLSILPVNLFAAPAPVPGHPALGRVWTYLRRPTRENVDEPAHVHMHIDMRDLQIHTGRLSMEVLDATTSPAGLWTSPAALTFHVSLNGAGPDYLRFPQDSRVMWAWGNQTMPDGYLGRGSWQIMVDASDLTTAGVPVPAQEWTAWFSPAGYQTGIITVYHTGPALPNNVVGNLRFDLPVERVRQGNTTMTAFFPGGGILAHGFLLGSDVTGIEIIADGEPVGFEWIASLNTLIIRESATSAITRELTGHRDNNNANLRDSIAGDRAGGNRAFAVRLEAPAGYHWDLPAAAVGVGPRRSGARPNYASYHYANFSGGAFVATSTNIYPALRSPQNVLVFDRVARYVYTTPGNRSEMILILENLRRNPTPVGEAPGEIHIEGLQLLPDERAPLTGDVNIDVEIGTVSTVRWHRAFRFGSHDYCPAGFSFGPNTLVEFTNPDTGAVTQGSAQRVRWTNEVPWRSNREIFRWAPGAPESLSRAEVEAVHRRSTNCYGTDYTLMAIVNGRLETPPLGPWTTQGTGDTGNFVPGQVQPESLTPGAFASRAAITEYEWLQWQNQGTPPCGETPGQQVQQVLRLDWYGIGDRVTRHVATRGIANLTLAVHGDLPDLRSGYANGHTDQDYVTGTTARLQIIENVPNALHLGIGAPINFTFPEGVEVMAFRWRMMPYSRTGADTFNWGDAPGGGGWNEIPPVNTPPVAGGGAITRWDGNTLSLTRNMPFVQNQRQRTMEIEFRVSVTGGFAWQSGNTLPVEVSGRAVEANLAPGASAVVANVFDPVVVEFPDLPITVPHVFLEQNIYHEDIGDIVIRETDGNRLQVGDEIWIYVQRTYIQRPWDIILSNGGLVHDNSGLTVRVEPFNVVDIPGLATQFHGLRLVVTGTSDPRDSGGTVTLTNNRVFGHVYPGEEYHITVTGPAIARNHILVSAQITPLTTVNGVVTPAAATQLQNRRGTFNIMPYFEELIDASEQIGQEEEPFQRHSLANVTIREGVAIGVVASPLYFEPVPGTNLVAGYVSARAFAIISGFENIHWNGAGRIATLSGYDALGRWTVIQLSPDSVTATVTRAGTTTHPDIAFVAGDSGPVGTIAPIHRNNRLYLPLRFMFNILAFDQFYEITGGPHVQSVTFVPLAD